MPDLVVKSLPDYDEIRVFNATTLSRMDDGKPDIGVVAARAKMQQVFSELAQANLIDAKGYDVATAGTGHIREGLMTQKAVVYERVKMYGFTLMRNINGIPVANAGLLIGIHAASGALTYLRIGGVTIESQWDGVMELPTSSGAIICTPTLPITSTSGRLDVDCNLEEPLLSRHLQLRTNGAERAANVRHAPWCASRCC